MLNINGIMFAVETDHIHGFVIDHQNIVHVLGVYLVVVLINLDMVENNISKLFFKT